MTYDEKLQLPQWQRKRLDIMQRANFPCEDCDTDQVQLHVHHSDYEPGLDPWDYPNDSLHCLCADCHQKAQNLNTLLQRAIGKLHITFDVERLLGYALGLACMDAPETPVNLWSPDMITGFAHVYEVEEVDLIKHILREGCIDGYQIQELKALKTKQKADHTSRRSPRLEE